ncbi:MAG: hypothetical protein K5656_00820, partial [Lachnospiraceae bacterium]|nr:hypothetical protein [Lachnospiraceae bacterium]
GVELGENISELDMVRTNGVGMPSLLKGNFTVGSERGCKLFLNPTNELYIKIETDDKTYYLSGVDDKETKAVYEEIKSAS